MFCLVNYVSLKIKKIVPATFIQHYKGDGSQLDSSKMYKVFFTNESNEDQAYNCFLMKAIYNKSLLNVDEKKAKKKENGYYLATLIYMGDTREAVENFSTGGGPGGRPKRSAPAPAKLRETVEEAKENPKSKSKNKKKQLKKTVRNNVSDISNIYLDLGKSPSISPVQSDPRNSDLEESPNSKKRKHLSPNKSRSESESGDDESDCESEIEKEAQLLDSESEAEKSKKVPKKKRRSDVSPVKKSSHHKNSEGMNKSDTHILYNNFRLSYIQWVACNKPEKDVRGDSKFVGNLAYALCGDSLKSKSLTGEKCRSVEGARETEKLDSKMLDCIKIELRKRILKETPVPTEDKILERVGKVEKYISSKIQNLNRKKN